MKNPILLLACIAVIFLASCSTEEAVLPTDSSSPEILQQLTQSEWSLIDCPDNQYLTINGQTECKYLANLRFEDNKVYITYKNTNISVMHHICYTNGDRMVVSIQDCSNTTWRSLFEWDVVSKNNNTMVVDVTVPNLAPGYNQRFTYEKMN